MKTRGKRGRICSKSKMVSKNINHIWGVEACTRGRKRALTVRSHPFIVLSITGCFDTFDAPSDLP